MFVLFGSLTVNDSFFLLLFGLNFSVVPFTTAACYTAARSALRFSFPLNVNHSCVATADLVTY